jgi:hypothetical protein
MTVRQVFYQATVRGLVEKAESGYGKVQTDLTVMRRAGELPYHWLADNTRWQRKPRTFDSVEEALKDTARFYRKALWADADAYVEIWLEKDALAGVVYPITSMYDVPLMVARGYASLSFLYSAAEYINTLDVPTFIYHCGGRCRPASAKQVGVRREDWLWDVKSPTLPSFALVPHLTRRTSSQAARLRIIGALQNEST